jgi:hypothetical protein
MTNAGELEESLSLASESFSSALGFSTASNVSTGTYIYIYVYVDKSIFIYMYINIYLDTYVYIKTGVAMRFTAMCENAVAVSMPNDSCCPSPGPVPLRRLTAQAAWMSCPRRTTREKAARSMTGPESSESDKTILADLNRAAAIYKYIMA